MEKLLKNTRLLVLIIALLFVSCYSALSTLPRAEDPPLINRWATITTLYPGASAERVEALVTEELENSLRTLNEINVIESQSKPGISIITIELIDELKNTEPAWSKIRDKLSDTKPLLPKETSDPNFDNDHAYAFTYIAALKWQGDSKIDPLILSRYAKELAKRWRNLSGTEFVSISGAAQEEILVTIDVGASSSLGQSAQTISHRIQQADAKNATGEIHSPFNRFQIEMADSFDSIDDIKQTIIASNEDGTLTKLQDIASIQRTPAFPAKQIALIDNKQVVLVSARMQNNIRVDNWTHASDDLLKAFSQDLPDNISLTPIFKQNRYTETRLSELTESLLFGFILVLLILFVTLGMRSAILVALSLPISAAFTLAMMSFTGLPINQMSVTGLIVSLGIMVDNAIVMVDSIAHYRQQGVKRLDAALRAISHLWLPLLGSTLTTILAFAPIFLMPGPAGEFVGAIALTVSFSLIGSYFVSQLLVASFAARWLPSGQKAQPWYQSGIKLPALNQIFRRSVKHAISHPWISIPLVFLFPLAGFLASNQLTEQFFPPSDRDMFDIQVYLDPQVSISTTINTVEQIESEIKKTENIEQITWVIGKNFPSFYYNMQGKEHDAANFAQAMVKVKDFRQANKMIPQLQSSLAKTFPNAQILVKKLEQGPPFNAPLEVRVYGENLDTLRDISEKIRLLMAATSYVENTRETLQPSVPKITVDFDKQASEQMSIARREMASLISASTSGIIQGSIIEETESIPVRVRVNDQYRQDLGQLNNLKLAKIKDNSVINFPISAISDLKIEPSRGTIPRRNGERVNVIEGYISAGVLPQTALNAFMQNINQADLTLPHGYRIEFGGESAERNDSISQLIASLTIVITLLITVIVVSFNSFRLSVIIFLVGIQAAGLGLLSVWLFNYPFGFTVIIGLLGLIGLAINSAIVILAEFRSDPKAKQGDIEAMVNSVDSCSRHICSTTITTVAGFLPLILAVGGFWPPFAITIAGGTLLTTLLSFYFVPTAFKLATKLAKFDKPSLLEN